MSATHELRKGGEREMPGHNIPMTITLNKAIALHKGLRFSVRAGEHTVGIGVVTEVIE
ncbi:hypothetical protein [Pseudomonas rubra]|uniref:EF-Tu C-terminal domain-related protein n=1 Tax=Pseudomonas rubra TaxID=2942627 RepID=UPI003B66FB1A